MEGYVIAMIIIFLSAFVVSVVFCTFCYKKGNNKKKKHGQRPARIDVRKRNRASISGQTYDSGGSGGDMHGNDNGVMAGAAATASLASIAINAISDGYHGDGGGGGADGLGGGDRGGES